MMGKADLDLDLLTTGHAPVEGPAVIEDLAHEGLFSGEIGTENSRPTMK